MYGSKWLPKNVFSFGKNSQVTKISKTTFPKEFSNEIGSNYKYIDHVDIAETKFG